MRPASKLPAALLAALLAACSQEFTTAADDSAPGLTGASPEAVAAAVLVVDPATLTPDPLSTSDEGTEWECRATGAGVKCVGHKVTPEVGVDIGLCGDRTLYVNGFGTRDQVRIYNGNLLETNRDVHLGAEEALSLSPDGTGVALSARQNILQKITFLVPGDLDTRVRTESGLFLQVRAPNGGVVFQQAGPQTYDENNELLGHRGRFDEDFLPTICAALLEN